jgi:hypothetical protein
MMLNVISLFNEYGACIESEVEENESDEKKYFIKFRINPLYFNVQFQQVTTKFEDTFYDDIEFTHGQKKEFYRNRKVISTVLVPPVFVHQDSDDLTFGIHCYNEKVLGKEESDRKKEILNKILTYSFERFYTDDENIYKDVITEPVHYEVISIKFKLENFNSQSVLKQSLDDAIKKLSDMLTPDIFNQFLLPYPTFSKFMYMIQFSENSDYYDFIYKPIDPAYEFIMPRIKNLVKNFSVTQIPQKVKLYVAIVSYIPNYFAQIIADENFSECKDDAYNEVKAILDEIKSETNLKSSTLYYNCDDEDY